MRSAAIAAAVLAASLCASAACVGNDADLVAGPESDGGASSADAAAAGCSRVVDALSGVFVDGSGEDTADCGGEAAPCRSLTRAFAQAKVGGAKTIYAGVGDYDVLDLDASITIEGGWQKQGSFWRPICTDDRATRAVIRPLTRNIAVAISAGVVTLRYLTIVSREAAAGESLYGVFATAGTITLDEVRIELGAGGNGVAGAGGATGQAGVVCAGVDDAVVGANGTDADMGGIASITGAGFTATVGGSGEAGGEGHVSGQPSQRVCNTTTCITCGGDYPDCNQKNVVPVCAGPVFGGCGGAGGKGGTAGAAGGASIAVFAANGAAVNALGAIIASGNGGQGGAGGDGGEGGAGTTKSVTTPCGARCEADVQNQTCKTLSDQSVVTATSPAGAKGGNGGRGAGGAGGWSYGVITIAGATFTKDATTTITSGQPGGAGLPNGAPGKSSAEGTF